jgi:hypothetical protein
VTLTRRGRQLRSVVRWVVVPSVVLVGLVLALSLPAAIEGWIR